MNLKLEKPLAFLDLETTGVNVSKDKIVEIAIIKINPDSSKEEYNKRINPEIPIPIETSEIHGIYDFDVINSPNFKAVSSEIEDFIKGCDLGGFNSNKFDIPLLVEEFYRCNIDIKIEERIRDMVIDDNKNLWAIVETSGVILKTELNNIIGYK